MAGVARIGDKVQGICNHNKDDGCPHTVTGNIVGGLNTVMAEGAGVARIGDKITTNCPHCGEGTIVGGSASVIAQGGVAHIGDKYTSKGGGGTIVSSAKTVIAG